ncbi:MAG: NAD(P)H-quinone oxidoreductase [Deltaproteobacteria bacterium]|nr:NAD(P)H-quinone oxidoreductase [Deltaproteobacteria bacterium]
MQCVEITSPGAPEVLQVGSRPRPQPAPGEVLVEVYAAGINRPDVLQRKGAYPAPPGASDIPGLEIAGTIASIGEGVTEWRTGDRVCSLVPGGGYAEYCTAHASNCLPVPRDFSWIMAADLPETFFTVWSNVFDRARLLPGETFLVQGGSSGIGTTAIQMAKAFGHRVFATAGSKDKCAACERLGAERAIHYREEDFVEVVKAETQGRGVDVILDMVAGDYLPREVQALAEDGRIVLIAFLGGAKATLDFGAVMRRRLTITGSTLRARDVGFKASIARSLRERVWPLLEQGKIAPVIHATFPLAEAAKAHALMETGSHIGKIVLTVR